MRMKVIHRGQQIGVLMNTDLKVGSEVDLDGVKYWIIAVDRYDAPSYIVSEKKQNLYQTRLEQ